jgi:formylglycine-generating enzyme required for sulfatase activity
MSQLGKIGTVFGMRRWFLSYNSQDLALMQGLEAALKRKDPEDKIFFAPTSLRAGGFWLPELAKGIAEASVFVLLVGAKGLGPWQVLEYYEALDRRVKQHDFPVILVLLDGEPAPGLPFLRQLHWIISADPGSEKCVVQILDAADGGGAPPGELWRHTAPYRGLAAMTEADSDFFFGRGRETVEVVRALEATPNKLPVLLGNSGVGKSSLAQAGVLAAFLRQGWPDTATDAGAWPRAFNESRTWCTLTVKPGAEPIRALVLQFFRAWQFGAADPARAKLQSTWIEELVAGAVSLRDLLDATELRYRNELHQSPPSAYLLYIDQGEELYVQAEPRQRAAFSKTVAEGLSDPRLRALMSLRADFFGELQKDEWLYGVHRLISVAPLREAQLREVVSEPAALLGARFENDRLAEDIALRAADQSSKDAGALPLLSYLLDDMWKSKDPNWDGVLRLPAPAIELGRVLVDRANAFMAEHRDAEEKLRRIFTLKLATVREDGEPTRRRAWRGEFSDDEWKLASELADHPNRLLVTATAEEFNGPRKAGEEGQSTYAEVAHEAIFRRWDKLREWIAAEREFLAWHYKLEMARSAYEKTPETAKREALLMGAALTQAQGWFLKRGEDLPVADREFIAQSIARERKRAARARFVRASIYGLGAVVILGLVGWINQAVIREQVSWYTTMRPYMYDKVRPYVLSAAAGRALKPGDTFRECAEDCPRMVVIPPGSFLMGSPPTEKGRSNNEGPQHPVKIGSRFAVSQSEITFADWDACESVGGCPHVPDNGWGRGSQPVINVTWQDAKRYAAWFSKMTGRKYRLPSEAEWEYVARAGTQTVYYWGDDLGVNHTNCNGCGSKWDGKQPSPAKSFPPNKFGLYDTLGNVWEWVEDCYHPNYQGAPSDGKPWLTGDCRNRVVRGGSWVGLVLAARPRSAYRDWRPLDGRTYGLGFRLARTLDP